ncbi:MAG: hypothetical protein UGF45_11985 [Massilioclostridium sp.]|nr:hypothetical protein [Massilioclostridium sp.]MEE1492697.1 hypothetical protein [Massilioclostridium sp.]
MLSASGFELDGRDDSGADGTEGTEGTGAELEGAGLAGRCSGFADEDEVTFCCSDGCCAALLCCSLTDCEELDSARDGAADSCDAVETCSELEASWSDSSELDVSSKEED